MTSTRSLTAAAVSYSDAGEHVLKGKVEPVRLHAAGAIVANVGGAQRVDGLEAPFVGRDHELRLVKELFHGAIEERRPRLVAVSGLAGVGKTRLAWEYEKYVDGITGTGSGGTAVGPCPTATASASGPWPRWCGHDSASSTVTRRPSSTRS